MYKRLLSLTLIFAVAISLFAGAVPTQAARDTITIRIHYHRPDGDYEGWDLWAWDRDGRYEISGKLANDGSASTAPPYKLESNNDEVICTLTVPSGIMHVGYLIRYGEWENMDVDYDQFINLTGIVSGSVDFYVESGTPSQSSRDDIPSMEQLCNKTIRYNGRNQNMMVLGNDVVLGSVVTSAKYDIFIQGTPIITVVLSSIPSYTVDTDTFSIYSKDGEIPNIIEVKRLSTVYYLYLDQELPLDQAYYIIFEDQVYSITMPDYYSNAEFEEKYTYEGNDLGQTYTREKTTLKVWAPLAVSVKVRLYRNGDPARQEDPDEEVDMTLGEKGVWSVELEGDMNGTYYTYYVDNYSEQKECVDPYARATGVNGRRGMIIDLAFTNPDGWANDKDPHYDDTITDAIIWELHVRDLTSDPSSGVHEAWRGKYLGLTQTGTTNSYGHPTGLDYIKNLGITHIHLLPVYDYGAVDETRLNQIDQFNWGYDPMNYNVPEGSYSTDPYNGEVRVKEFKQMVKTLHDNGISVIMDVVYNHVYDSAQFCMNNTVPDYFSRPNSNGSGCGNDTASERSMVSKYIVDSVNYWADEYHIDGFRFDLAGLIDTNTINEIVKTVHENHPNVIFYGEGWTMGTITTKPGVTLATQTNSGKTPNFAYFSDTIRNDLKGGTFGGVFAGYISGGDIGDLDSCFRGMPSWCSTPTQSVNYISCHDNFTLYDHISLVNPYADATEKADINKLGAAFYLAAQGVPFMQAGEEMLRSKPANNSTDLYNPNVTDGYFDNSYNAPDQVNSLKWDSLNNRIVSNTIAYYQGLIAFRKAHPALRMTNANQVQSNITNLPRLDDRVLGYHISGSVVGETADGIIAIFNSSNQGTTVDLPEGQWHICVNKDTAGVTPIDTVSGSVYVDGTSAMFLVKSDINYCIHPSHNDQGYCIVCESFVGHSYGENGLCFYGKEEPVENPTAPTEKPSQDQPDKNKENKQDKEAADERSSSNSLFDLIDPVTLIAIILLTAGVATIVVIVIILKRKKT